VIDVDQPTLGRLQLAGPPLRFFAGPDAVEVTADRHAAPPTLGQHNQEVLAWLERMDATALDLAAETPR